MLLFFLSRLAYYLTRLSISIFTEDSMDQTDADEMDTAIKDSDNEAEETENESANTPLTRRKRVSEFYT